MLAVIQQNQELLVNLSWMFIAVLFLVSGLMKLATLKQFVGAVGDFDMLPEPVVGFVARGLPVVEVLIGTTLLLDVYRTGLLILAAALLTVFAAAVTINLLRGRSYISCGCFGSDDGSQLTWSLVGRNLLFIAIALFGLTGAANEVGIVERLVIAVSVGSLMTAHYLYGLVVKLRQPQF